MILAITALRASALTKFAVRRFKLRLFGSTKTTFKECQQHPKACLIVGFFAAHCPESVEVSIDIREWHQGTNLEASEPRPTSPCQYGGSDAKPESKSRPHLRASLSDVATSWPETDC